MKRPEETGAIAWANAAAKVDQRMGPDPCEVLAVQAHEVIPDIPVVSVSGENNDVE